jgi:hypothetical protein
MLSMIDGDNPGLITTGGVVCGGPVPPDIITVAIVVRAETAIEEHNKRYRIVVSEIPFQQSRRIEERIADAVNGKSPAFPAVAMKASGQPVDWCWS